MSADRHTLVTALIGSAVAGGMVVAYPVLIPAATVALAAFVALLMLLKL
ncbi:hypothetical protein SSPS47_35195 (plasmid) [Streptomyces sp. S4.7]|nr:hypothetical protein [Streptomyces sp. S4.7]QHZ00350.1 hypothetical protein SSPS47_35195 [Streptomyces sp. S4.7]